MEPAVQDAISKLAAEADSLIQNDYGKMLELDAVFNGPLQFMAKMTQQQIDSVPSFAANGATLQQIADGNAAVAAVKNAIANAYTALVGIAQLK